MKTRGARRALWLLVLVGCADPGGEDVDDAGVVQDDVVDGARGGARDSAESLAEDGGLRPDLSVEAPDAGLDLDLGDEGDAARHPDAAPDLGRADPDAASPDAGWGDCVGNGRPGTCLDVVDCGGEPIPGFCPGPAEIQCCVEPDAPPPGECDPRAVPNRPIEEAVYDELCPAGMVALHDEACVDRYEAHLVDDEGEPWSPFQNPGVRQLFARSAPGVVPQGYINGDQAGQACANSGKRLCTRAEWLSGCQGPEGFTYPYGDARRPGLCNDARARHPAVELFPNDPNPFDRIQEACINQLPDSLARTGAHPECVGDLGTFDMMGNLHEWVADPSGTFQGGFYVDTVRNGNGCLYRTTAHNTLHWDYSTGFRCCADAR